MRKICSIKRRLDPDMKDPNSDRTHPLLCLRKHQYIIWVK